MILLIRFVCRNDHTAGFSISLYRNPPDNRGQIFTVTGKADGRSQLHIYIEPSCRIALSARYYNVKLSPQHRPTPIAHTEQKRLEVCHVCVCVCVCGAAEEGAPACLKAERAANMHLPGNMSARLWRAKHNGSICFWGGRGWFKWILLGHICWIVGQKHGESLGQKGDRLKHIAYIYGREIDLLHASSHAEISGLANWNFNDCAAPRSKGWIVNGILPRGQSCIYWI